jgi:hypothetical protein
MPPSESGREPGEPDLPQAVESDSPAPVSDPDGPTDDSSAPAPAHEPGTPVLADGPGWSAPPFSPGGPAPAYDAGAPAPAPADDPGWSAPPLSPSGPVPAYGPGTPVPGPAYGAGGWVPAYGPGTPVPGPAYGPGGPVPAYGPGTPVPGPAYGAGGPVSAPPYGPGGPAPALPYGPGGPGQRGPGRRRLRIRLDRRGWTLTVTGVAVIALVVGLIFWEPWKPNPPSAVRATASSATTAQVTWAAAGGITSPDHYLVLRDGQQVASVPASSTSWTDHGLSPGVTYDYRVIAAGWGQSSPSAAATVTTLIPSPVGLTVTHVTYSTVMLRWSPPGDAPAPDLYEIFNGPDLVDTIEGTVTTYTDTSQQPGNTFQYSVVAEWGDHKSAPSAPALGELLSLPVSGSVPVSVVTTSTPGNGASLSVGYHWDDVWTFSGSCPGDNCAISADIGIKWYTQYQSNPYTVTLHGSGGTFSGTGQVPKDDVTRCGTSSSSVPTSDTVTLTIKAKGPVVKGAWQAWTGTMVYHSSSATLSNGGYCPAVNWEFAVTTTN